MPEIPMLLFSLGSMPLFASRSLSAVFWIAAAARLQAEGLLTVGENLGPLQLDLSLAFPSWLIADSTLLFLLLLTVAESLVDKSPDLRLLLTEFDPMLKVAGKFIFDNVALGASLSIVAAAGVRQAGFGGALWAVVPAVGVWLLAHLRRGLLSFLSDLDEDDDLGIQKLISWAEDGWVGAGTLFLVLLPGIALAVSALTICGLWLVQLAMQHREEGQKVPCKHCAEPILPSAPTCFSCRTPVAEPMAVGAFGQPTKKPARNLDEHRLRLLSKKRCLVCATRLKNKKLRQHCSACGSEMLPSLEWVDRYIAHVESKLPKTLLVCLVVGLVPILGLIPGIIYYRLGLISALRAYVPPGRGILTRWVVRLSNIILLALQWIPILGALTLPLMCYLNYRIYRRVLLSQKRSLFALELAPA